MSRLQLVSYFYDELLPVAYLILILVIIPGEQKNPARLNVELVKRLQFDVAPQVFTPRAVYDGRKNLYASHELRFANKASSQEVSTLELLLRLRSPKSFDSSALLFQTLAPMAPVEAPRNTR